MSHPTPSYAKGFRAEKPHMDPAERIYYRRTVPALGMPRAFADFLARFPFPPDWSQQATHDGPVLLDVALILAEPHHMAQVTLANICAILPGAAITVVHRPADADWVQETLLAGGGAGCARRLEVGGKALDGVPETLWPHFRRASRVMLVRPGSVLLRNTILDFLAEQSIPGDGLALHDPAVPLAAARPAHPLRAMRFVVQDRAFAIPLGMHRPWRFLRSYEIKEILQCAPAAAGPGNNVPRLWETHRWEIAAAAPETDVEEIAHGVVVAALASEEADLLRAWVRLGTNRRGFFADEGARLPPMAGWKEGAPAAAEPGRWGWTLLVTDLAAGPPQAVAAVPVTCEGVLMRRLWLR